jgi:hypothetical protein
MTPASIKYSFLIFMVTSLYAFKGSKVPGSKFMKFCTIDLAQNPEPLNPEPLNPEPLNPEPRSSERRSYF